MEMCNFWKDKSKNLLCWQGLVILDWPWQVRTCPISDFWSNFACFVSKTYFLKQFLDRSASFFGQEIHEHLKTIKKCCVEAKNDDFRKSGFKKDVFSLCFPPISTFRIQNWLFYKISRWFCMVLLGEAEKHVLPTQNFNIWPKIQKYF